MAFRYKVKKKRQYVPTRRPTIAKRVEQLSGAFKGMKASDIEERFGNALMTHPSVVQVLFRMPVGAPRGMPGWKELDFLVQTHYGWRAFQTDDIEFIHVGGSKVKDALTDLVIRDALKRDGIEIREVERIKSIDLNDFKQAKAKVMELL